MNKRIYIWIMIILAAMSLCGCQLAVESKEETYAKARLIGAFITTEHLDLFDMEGYLNDNIGKFASGGNMIVEPDARYEGRVYAAQSSKTVTASDGHTYEDVDYDFEGIEGYSLFAPIIEDSLGNPVTTMIADEVLCESHLSVGDDTRLEATIYMRPHTGAASFYVNPVYQDADGAVYLTAGTGITTIGNTVGGGMSQEISEKHERTAPGEVASESASVKVHFSVRNAPIRISVLQMNEAGELLSRELFSANALLDSMNVENKTAYLIVETFAKDWEGRETVSREIIANDEKGIETFTEGERGLLIPKYIEIIWE